jgi:hypothetical protein
VDVRANTPEYTALLLTPAALLTRSTAGAGAREGEACSAATSGVTRAVTLTVSQPHGNIGPGHDLASRHPARGNMGTILPARSTPARSDISAGGRRWEHPIAAGGRGARLVPVMATGDPSTFHNCTRVKGDDQ